MGVVKILRLGRRSFGVLGGLACVAVGVVSACSSDTTDSDTISDDGVSGDSTGGVTGGDGTGAKGGRSGSGGGPSSGGRQGRGGDAGNGANGGDGEAGEGAVGGTGTGGDGGGRGGGGGSEPRAGNGGRGGTSGAGGGGTGTAGTGTAGTGTAGTGTSGGAGGVAGRANGGAAGQSAGAGGRNDGGTGQSGQSGAGGSSCSCVHGSCAGMGCVCDTGFAGSRCDQCEAGHFGPTCLPCTCQNGVCSDGITGSGACSCQLGWVGATCNVRPVSCRVLASQFPSASTGTYVIDPDGDGSIAPFNAYCDMTYDGGGWTLIMASNGLGPAMQVPGLVTPSSGTYMPIPATLALAAQGVSSQIHIRAAGQATVASITSTANSLPIANLRARQILNANSGMYSPSAIVTDWTGPYATTTHLWHSCGPPPYGTYGGYPEIWWSCNNGGGLHLVNTFSGWTSEPTQMLAMEVYLR